METKRQRRAERSRFASATAQRLDLDGEHGDGRRRVRFEQSGRPNPFFLENRIRANILLMKTHVCRPAPPRSPAALDATARGVKCPVATAQDIDIIELTVKLSLDNS
jgi:hypothetical protein